MIPVLPQQTVLPRETANTARPKWRSMRLLAVVLLLAISMASVAGGVIHQLIPARADSGDWPTYLHDPQRTAAGGDTILSTSNAGQLGLKWAFPTGGPIAASPSVVGGTVYVGSWDGYEYALDAITGTMKWKTFLGQTTAPCYPQLTGVSSAADVENGMVYVGGGDSYWYALDATTGNVLWKVFVTAGTRNQTNQTLSEAIVALDANTLAVKSSWAVPNSMETVDSDFGNTPLLFNDSHGNPLVTAVNKNGLDYAWNRNNLAAGPVWSQMVTLPGSCPQCGDGSVSSGAFANGTLFQAGGSTVINGVGYRGAVRAL